MGADSDESCDMRSATAWHWCFLEVDGCLSVVTQEKRMRPIISLLTALVCLSCGDDDSDDNPTGPGEDQVGATTALMVMETLERAFEDRDKELYGTLLDERFWFTEDDCAGDLVFQNGREEESAIMGARDGSEGILDQFQTIDYEFLLIEHLTELGADFPNAFEGDPDGHPDEDWEVFRGRVAIELLVERDTGFRVDQTMNYKLRKGDDDLWRMARWIDDPLAGDCGGGDETGKVVTPPAAWSQVKQRH